AFNEINRLIEANPDDPSYYGVMGELYLKNGDKKNALKYYNKVLTLDPDNGYAEFSLSGFYEEEGDFEKAFEYLEKAFRNDGIDTNTKVRYYLMQKSGKEESTWTGAQMNKLITILLEKYPDNNLMYREYAQFFIRLNKLKEAGEYLKKYLDDNPSDKEMWQQLLFIHNNNRNFESLYSDGKKAISFFPDQSVFYALHAVGALQLEKYEEVLNDCQKGESLIKNNSGLMVQFELFKADALYKLKRIKEVLISYDKILKIDPKNYMVMNNYAYYLSVLNKDLDKAEHMSRQVIQANSDSSIYIDTYAWILFKQKKYSKALTFMKMALNSGGDKSGVQVEHYGDILFCSGEEDKAIEKWKEAKKIGDTSKVLEKKIREKRYIENKEFE
ncbi:MAG: tetratricopeptide repeat protein, partial [Prolixibacteraceae bacterium]|nr:tetratricopeptide repeat protein [Prolixibacteraceae bacterium]